MAVWAARWRARPAGRTAGVVRCALSRLHHLGASYLAGHSSAQVGRAQRSRTWCGAMAPLAKRARAGVALPSSDLPGDAGFSGEPPALILEPQPDATFTPALRRRSFGVTLGRRSPARAGRLLARSSEQQARPWRSACRRDVGGALRPRRRAGGRRMCVRLSPAAAAEASASAEHACLRRDWRLCACWARQGCHTRQHAAWGALMRPLEAARGARARNPLYANLHYPFKHATSLK